MSILSQKKRINSLESIAKIRPIEIMHTTEKEFEPEYCRNNQLTRSKELN